MGKSTESFPDLTREGFDACPVWTWSESNDSYSPVWKLNPLPEDVSTLFLKARLEAASGECFSGYLVGRKSFYAFAIFLEGAEYVVNLNLPETVEEAVSSIGMKLGRNLRLFPLKYETDLHFEGESCIAGVFRQP